MAGITDFTSLKTEAADWADIGENISDDKLTSFVQMTTHIFNYGSDEVPALRTNDMLVVEALTPTSGVCALPSDYLQYRRVVESNSRRNPLSYITPSKADELYPSRPSGYPRYFSIVGSSLYTFPLTSSDVELTYYQKIPELSGSATTNWLLLACPAIYLHGVLMQIGLFWRDADLQARSAQIIVSLANGLAGSDQMANYAFAPSYATGMTVA